MNTYGNRTKPTVVVTHESHKLHLEFPVADGATIGRSQPIKLNAAGEALPLEPTDHRNLCVGVSMHFSPQPQGDEPRENITAIMKPFLTILCIADGEVEAGPVAISGEYFSILSTKKEGPSYGQNRVENVEASADNFFGIAIEPAADGGNVEVVVFG